MFLFVHHMFMHNTSFNLKHTGKIWKMCLFHNSFKFLNLGYHHPHTFTRIYFLIQMQYLINWIRIYHMHTHKFNLQIDWPIGWYNMNVDHHNLEDQFHRTRWVPNTFPPCNIASKFRSRLSRSNAHPYNFRFSDCN